MKQTLSSLSKRLDYLEKVVAWLSLIVLISSLPKSKTKQVEVK